MPFERHSKKYYAPRPSWNRGATINGKPAWLVVQERRKIGNQTPGDWEQDQ